jgi:hypothetical protein
VHAAVSECIVTRVPPVRNLAPGYTVIHPNRDKFACKATKAIVVLILIVSVAMMLIVTIGGWSKLQGLKPLNFAWCIAYLILALYIWRWSRGLLPIAAALGILLLIVAVIAGIGLAGTSWFDRSAAGFAAPSSLFGGRGLSPNTIGVVTILIAPVQVLLIFFTMQGFLQGWNVELEVPLEEAQRRGSTPIVPPATPAAA